MNNDALRMTRRQMITITAGVAGTAGFAGLGGVSKSRAAQAAPEPSVVHEWRGIALGAQTSIKLAHEDRRQAVEVLARCRNEVDRLESIFSLYRPGSEISHLNRDGVLIAPSHEMRQCLAEATRIGRITQGAFDITVGPLWNFHARGSWKAGAELRKAELQALLKRVDFLAVHQEPGRVFLEHEGMGITLNGIAQGYITDRVASLLRGYGFSRVLVCLGEIHALDAPGDGHPWTVQIDGAAGTAPGVTLENTALATSSARGLVFERSDGPKSTEAKRTRASHLVNPHTGEASPLWDQVSVVAPTAACADALSTGLSFVESAAWISILESAGAHYAIGSDGNGKTFRFENPNVRAL
jgi:thiamine biosynthesis lipoprotein